MASILQILILFLCGIEASSFSVGYRSILRVIGDTDPPDSAVDLNTTNFDSVLRDSSAKFAIVEFFSHLCPACRNYKPHYEKVAKLFNGNEAVHPGIILMTRVDCALKININLCDKFSVRYYPMLLWGPPSKFGSGWEPNENSEIISIDDVRTADRLLNWINEKIGSTYNLDDEKYDNDHLTVNMSQHEQIVRAVYDVEEATSSVFDIILEHKMINSVTRAPLLGFLQLLVAHHPSKRCREGSAEILVNFNEFSPSEIWSSNNKAAVSIHGKDALQSFHICGEVPRGNWIFCRGSKKDTRGFSCGLWVLLHSLSVRIENGESDFAFRTTCDFIHNFFICEECRQHFYEMCSSISTPFKKASDFALWLWDAHNKVNERLMKEEASLETGDPKFPKMIWPPKQLCRSCYLSPPSRTKDGTLSIEWNKDEVFKFLVDYYGKKLLSSNKDSTLVDERHISSPPDEVAASTNVVAVPLGAALGIALASCGFGVLACFWRSKQKNRKYFHGHSIKNI